MSKAFENIFPIGLGTARFPFKSKETYAQDFENAVNLVLYALEQGVNYIDVGRGYSFNNAISVLNEAFKRTNSQYNVTIKVNSFDKYKDKDYYYAEAISVLNDLGLSSASHFLLWTLMDIKHFKRSISENNIYDAALQLKKEGKIKYIGASLHMQHTEILEVIDSGLFEFLLISCHLLNFGDMQKVLDRAYEKGIDILVMNPLYGGLIPQNETLFEYAKMSENETVIQAAIRSLLSHPAIKCVLAGASNTQQLDNYISAVKDDLVSRQVRFKHLMQYTTKNQVFCSYCRYCVDCPMRIPVPEIMNARNIIALHGVDDGSNIESIFFRLLNEKFNLTFETYENPCIGCGKCESHCTQHLDIIKSIDLVYKMLKKTCYDMKSRKERFEELIPSSKYKKIGFWPASQGTMKILDVYKHIFNEIPFDIYLFDSNSSYIGTNRFGYKVYSASEAKDLGIECILITSYKYGKDIYEQNKHLEQQGIDLKVLYKDSDVDWWW